LGGKEDDRPVIAGSDEAGALLVATVVLGGFYNELKSVFHRELHRNRNQK
jgi:hypothetical protein